MIPVITVDGASGTGKSVLATKLAEQMSWHCLRSGLIYRGLAWIAHQKHIPFSDVTALRALIDLLSYREGQLYCDQQPAFRCAGIHDEEIAHNASQLSQYPDLRIDLLPLQRQFRIPPGLVAEGRDMGSVVFNDASVKIFLIVEDSVRVRRRCAQLKKSGKIMPIKKVMEMIRHRDHRDRHRDASPLQYTKDAILLDNSEDNIQQTLQKIIEIIRRKQPTFLQNRKSIH